MLALFVILHSPIATKPETNDSKLRRAAYQRDYKATPEYKAQQKAYRASDQFKANRKAYRASDQYKAYQKAYRAKKKIEQEKKIIAINSVLPEVIKLHSNTNKLNQPDYLDIFNFNCDSIEGFEPGDWNC